MLERMRWVGVRSLVPFVVDRGLDFILRNIEMPSKRTNYISNLNTLNEELNKRCTYAGKIK